MTTICPLNPDLLCLYGSLGTETGELREGGDEHLQLDGTDGSKMVGGERYRQTAKDARQTIHLLLIEVV